MSGTAGINPSALAAALTGTGGQAVPQPPSALANGNAGVNQAVPLGSLPPSLALAPNANALQSGAPSLPWYAVPGMFGGTPAPGAAAAPPGAAALPPGAGAQTPAQMRAQFPLVTNPAIAPQDIAQAAAAQMGNVQGGSGGGT